MADDLGRFLQAQDEGGTYQRALAELQAGAKRSHWMWFVFPQLAGLGRSPTARYFGVADVAEARAYLAHPVLGQRLRACTEAMLGWSGRKSARDILGSIDAMKFASSMTLFGEVDEAADSLFAKALEGFCDGRRDPLTLQLLGKAT